MAKSRVVFFASKDVQDLIKKQGQPKEIEKLMESIYERFKLDPKAFEYVKALLEDETLIIATKLINKLKK